MGFGYCLLFLAHQGGKHIAKLTTVNEKTIVESESFKNAKMDEDIKSLLLTDDFKNKLEEGSVESVLTDSTFIAELNAKSEKDYAKSTVYISERLKAMKATKGVKEKELKAAKVDFLSYEKDVIISDTVSEAKLAELSKNTPGTPVINAIKSESLKKGLGVFEMLGFIAVACGLLLFVIGRPLKNGCTELTKNN